MGFDPVPWMVGGNVKHSTNVARLLAYVAFGGREGVIDPTDLYVRERAVPAGSVRIAPGACSILNRALNIKAEAYAARLPTEDYVDIAPTGSGGWRTDLVVARVENPFLTGEPYPEPSPENVAAGNVQFVYARVIPNVLSGTTGAPQHPTDAQVAAALAGMSAIPLASVAVPASTATIAQSYIRDRRALAQVQQSTLFKVVNVAGSVAVGASYTNLALAPVDVPSWATHFSVAILGAGIVQGTGSALGGVRAVLSSVATEPTGWNSVVANADRIIVAAGASDVPIPANLRGTTQNIAAQMNKSSGTGTISADTASSVRFDVVFHAKPEAIAA